MNKYQKANEFIRLSEEQKESIVANLLKEDTAPARKPFFLKPWIAGLGVAFAVLVLYFGFSRRPAPAPLAAPALQETTASGAAEDSATAAGEEAEMKNELRSENEYNGVMDTLGSVPEAAAPEKGSTRVIIGKEAEEIDAESYGEKRETVILDTEVTVYGNRAAVFVCKGETVAIVSGEEFSEEELTRLVSDIIRDFGN